MSRLRADKLLLARGLVESRTRAQSLIAAGHVTSAGRIVVKAGEMLDEEAPLALAPEALAYVSRGALKLAHALDHFAIPVVGRVALDLGASTGGFTEILLERGVRRVYAVDVGHGQLHPRLKSDPRVVCLEGTDARRLSSVEIPQRPEIITADVSFIGLAKALGPALLLAAPGAHLVALVKPQFEVGPAGVGKGGIVRDPHLREKARRDVAAWLDDRPGWHNLGTAQSPIEGGDGNVEFLIAAQNTGG